MRESRCDRALRPVREIGSVMFWTGVIAMAVVVTVVSFAPLFTAGSLVLIDLPPIPHRESGR